METLTSRTKGTSQCLAPTFLTIQSLGSLFTSKCVHGKLHWELSFSRIILLRRNISRNHVSSLRQVLAGRVKNEGPRGIRNSLSLLELSHAQAPETDWPLTLVCTAGILSLIALCVQPPTHTHSQIGLYRTWYLSFLLDLQELLYSVTKDSKSCPSNRTIFYRTCLPPEPFPGTPMPETSVPQTVSGQDTAWLAFE